ncbi:hypothetical protein INS49_005012 [Diaporthe citri]|uniref:uncharacterized protein n=1 Tax=Diaporthe citri TaxID=83186 RepID=UPI001C80FF2C|nr:uncharacterized protein INS49_005012 [Diaporthe citri]KAG6354041.1 hypothetical protein INS49_005012 [Diaporthe citri]
MATFVDHYAVLGVKSTANLSSIKKAYRQLALQHHPDKAAPDGKVDAAKFISAQAAYEILVDVSRRKAYDIQYDKRSKAAHATRLAHKQATRLARFYQRETDGSYGGGYGRDEMGGDEEDEVVEDYPSDTPTDPGSECEDTGVYEDGYADPHYKPYRNSNDVVYGSFYSCGIYVGDPDFDSTDSHYQFPDDLADGFSPAQGCDDEGDTISEFDSDEESPAPCISHPLTEAFDAFANMSKSHYLEEKVLGRYYKGALYDLQRKKTECNNIGAQLVDIAVRVRKRVSSMPAGSFKLGEFEEALSRKLGAARRALDDVRASLEASLRVMRVEHQPQFWRLMNKRTWSVLETIERSATHMEKMKEALSDLEEIVIKLEGWPNEELGKVKGYLGSFMHEFRDWQKEITSAMESQRSSLGLLDEEHMAIFRNALGNLLLTEASESTYAEIVDGLPTLDPWNEFHFWAPVAGNPIRELEHKELCAGSREKAQKLRSEFDVYILLFPSQLLRDFQDARPGTKEHALSLIELLARSCHQLAVFIFQLDDGVHKHALYEAWRDAPNVDPLKRVSKKPPSAFSNAVYHFYEQYPNGLADVVGYWAESKIFGGVVVFDRGPSGIERLYLDHQRREMYLHGCSIHSPFTLFPPTDDQFESLVRFLMSPLQDGPTADQKPSSRSVQLPIKASSLNGWRYHPDGAMCRFNIFRDRYERLEPPTKRWSNSILSGTNWPETGYEMTLMLLDIDRRNGKPVDEAVVAEAQAGIKRITPSSPIWPDGGST